MREDQSDYHRREFLRVGASALGGAALSLTGVPMGEAAGAPAADLWALTLSGAGVPVPRRLSDATHELARRGLSGEAGREMVSLNFDIDKVVDTSGMSLDMRIAQTVRQVAERAPVRVLPFERIVGSATVLEATSHYVPGIPKHPTISHTTIGFGHVLKVGYAGLRRQIAERLSRGDLDAKGVDLLSAMQFCIDAAGIWHRRYMTRLEELAAASSGDERANYQFVLTNLRNVPEHPPESFAEAVQALWFLFAFQRLNGTWSGIGRIDQMLGGYLERDLATGKITLDEARELVAHFWVKGTEWSGLVDFFKGSGDAQYYQNIVLGGIDRHGREVTNAVTYLVLDVVEELHISDFMIAVRLNRQSPPKLLERIAEVQRHGGGIVAVYNEETIIKALVEFGYPLAEAREFANDGCWEPVIPGKTIFKYHPYDLYPSLQRALGLEGGTGTVPAYSDFESLYAAFKTELQAILDANNRSVDGFGVNERHAPLVSLFVEDCIERGRGYGDRGPRYTVAAIHVGGVGDVGNSLLAIKKLVYDEKMLTLTEMVEILRSDWRGQEPLRRFALNRLPKYGNDHDEADAMVKRVYDDYTGYVGRVKVRNGVLRPAGISTFGREIQWRSVRKATPAGSVQGELLATNFSPAPGTDREGPTAVLKSYCKMDYTKLPSIGTVELKVLPASVRGEAGVRALSALMRSFVKLGGCFMHIDVVDTSLLLDAQRHPEKYPNLSVRIAGWSARFATLNRDWQDMIIGRTQQVL